MKRSESKYPVGATWEAVDKKDPRVTAKIWLARIDCGMEIWMYNCNQSRWFSALNNDWALSYRMAKQMCPIDGRFKRVK